MGARRGDGTCGEGREPESSRRKCVGGLWLQGPFLSLATMFVEHFFLKSFPWSFYQGFNVSSDNVAQDTSR